MAEVLRYSKRSAGVGLAALAGLMLTALSAVNVLISDRPQAITDLLLYKSLMPRTAMALVAGATLGLAGALLQRVLRNPIADPSTLGIASGVQLALAAATIYAPSLMETSRQAVGLAGGLAAVLVVLTITSKSRFDPISVVLTGMLVSLTAGAASAALVLANGEYMMSLFIWGGGSLVQDSWEPTIALLIRLGLGFGASVLLLRPLALLGLSDSSAGALGLAVRSMRLVVIAVAVWLSVAVTVEVGVIGFVGLAAPAIARLTGVRSQRTMLFAAPAAGALVLWLTDGLVQMAGIGGIGPLPTGSATALLGGPLLLWLVSRFSPARPPAAETSMASSPVAGVPMFCLVAVLAGVAIAGLFVGRSSSGWSFASGDQLEMLLAWRWPRVAIAASCGAMLAGAGVLMQRITANPLASPEVLGIAGGAGLGLAAVLLLFPTPTRELQLLGTAIGSLLTFLAILAATVRGAYGPERLLLAGVAVGSLAAAVITALIASGKPEAFQLLGWLSGSTNAVLPRDAAIAGIVAIVLLAPLPLFGRWLAILPLGAETSGALGLNVRRVGVALVAVASVLTAASSLFVGPLSFVGLMAPHMARFAGFREPRRQIVAAVIIGAVLMVLADWLARMIAFPYQLPLGLLASLIGAPYFVWLLRRGEVRHG